MTDFLTCASTATTLEAGKACGTTLFTALGIPGADCLDPAIDPILKGLDSLIFSQNPADLQQALMDLPNTLPGTLATLASCTSSSSSSATPTPSDTPTEGTSSAAGSATVSSDPTAAVPVVANPTFTG